MRTIPIHSRVATSVCAIVLLLQMSPAMAQGKNDNKGPRDHNRPVEVTFTKWVIPGSATLYPLLAGFTGGDIAGVFVGEQLHRVMSQAQPGHSRVAWIEAVYEVQDEDARRSFTALIGGGTSAVTGAALLDGVILAGWRTGALVYVEFQAKPAPSPNESACVGAPPGITCFEGTIHVGRVPRADD